jgi:hypothetical protein
VTPGPSPGPGVPVAGPLALLEPVGAADCVPRSRRTNKATFAEALSVKRRFCLSCHRARSPMCNPLFTLRVVPTGRSVGPGGTETSIRCVRWFTPE